MKPWIWLRVLAGILAFFTVGHTLGTAAPHVTRGAREAAVFAAMQGFRFPVMGFNRTHWDFYRGFALTISLLLLALTILAWQLSRVSMHEPRQALPMAVTLQAACLGLVVLSAMFFFGAPLVTAVVALLCATVAVVALVYGRSAASAPAN